MTAQGVTAEYTVEGTTYSPEGKIYDHKGNLHTLTAPLVKTAEISALCNDSKIVYNAVRHLVPKSGLFH